MVSLTVGLEVSIMTSTMAQTGADFEILEQFKRIFDDDNEISPSKEPDNDGEQRNQTEKAIKSDDHENISRHKDVDRYLSKDGIHLKTWCITNNHSVWPSAFLTTKKRGYETGLFLQFRFS